MSLSEHIELQLEKLSQRGKLKQEIVEQTDTNLDNLDERVDDSVLPPPEENLEFNLEEFANGYKSRLSGLTEDLSESSIANLNNGTDFERTDFVNTATTKIKSLEADVAALREKTNGGDVVVYGSAEINLGQIESQINNLKAILARIDISEREITEEAPQVESLHEFLELDLNARLQMICGVGLNQLREGVRLSFRFPNKEMAYLIGIDDLLPDEIRTVESNGVTYERQGNQGFYNNNIYLTVFNGSRITVGAEDDDYSVEEEFANKFEDVSGEFTAYPTEEEKVEGSQSINTTEIYDHSLEFLIDPFLLQTILELLRERFSGEYGSENEFLHMAARFIQNAENSYRQIEGDEPITNGFYSTEFLVYALDHFNLFNHRNQQFDAATIQAVIEKYGELKGVSSLMSITLDLEETRGNMDSAYDRPYVDTATSDGFRSFFES